MKDEHGMTGTQGAIVTSLVCGGYFIMLAFLPPLPEEPPKQIIQAKSTTACVGKSVHNAYSYERERSEPALSWERWTDGTSPELASSK